MGYNGYLSKHLYSTIKSCAYSQSKNNKDEVEIFLENQELDFLNFFGIEYHKSENKDNPYLYFVNLNEIQKVLFSC